MSTDWEAGVAEALGDQQSGQEPGGKYQPREENAFWEAREELRHIRAFARSRRVGPWALLGCVVVRVIANVPPWLVLPPLIGGPVSLNLFVGITSLTGGGKGAAESAAVQAVKLPEPPIYGPGSGEGLAHLFATRGRDGKLDQHTDAVILSAAEVGTLAALKARQASTLLPELRKAWMGEPLGFGYADHRKRLNLGRHKYRLCMIVGIQPASATPILEDAEIGTPQRFLWLPANDPDAPDVAPEMPTPWRDPRAREVRLTGNDALPDDRARQLLVIELCQAGREEIDATRVRALRGMGGGDLDSHALLAQEKIAAGLMLLNRRYGAISEEDWQLARVARDVSDETRQDVINVLWAKSAEQNQVRGRAEADRAVIVDQRREEVVRQRLGRSIVAKVDALPEGEWIAHSKLRKGVSSSYRDLFDEVIDPVVKAGLIEMREIEYQGRQGREYRSALRRTQ
jgi:hypothetical protein